MNYKVLMDNNFTLYQSNDSKYFIENPYLQLKTGKVSQFSFVIYPNHPFFYNIEKLISKITIYKNDKKIFIGRVISEEQRIDNSKFIECESTLSYFNDTKIDPFLYNGTITGFLEFILD